MDSEFEHVAVFGEGLLSHLRLGRDRLLVIPGNHDINRSLCESYFLRCAGKGKAPEPPYWAKWESYVELFARLYRDVDRYLFTELEPWTLFEIPSLRVVVAGLNSTIHESHRDSDHHGFIGENQLRWFDARLAGYARNGWLRVGIIHHNVMRRATDDNENLKDAESLREILGDRLHVLLHGHTHQGGVEMLGLSLPVIATGSAAVKRKQRPGPSSDELGETPNQYQLVRLTRGGLTCVAREYTYERKRWIGDNRVSRHGDRWWYSLERTWLNAGATFPAPAAVVHHLGSLERSTANEDDETLKAMQIIHRAIALQVDDETKLIDKAIRALTANGDTDDVAATMKRIVGAARELRDGALAILWPYYEEGEQFAPFTSASATAQYEKDVSGRESNKIQIPSRVLRARYLAVKNIEDDTFILDDERKLLIELGVHSFQGTVLEVGNERLGVLCVSYNQPRSFNDADQRLLTGFAAHAAHTLRSSRLLLRLHEAERMSKAVTSLAPLTFLERTLENVAAHTKEVLGCDVAVLHVYSASTDMFEHRPSYAGDFVDGLTANRGPSEDLALARWAMNQPAPVAVEDLERDPLFAPTRFAQVENIQSCLALPLNTADGQFGVLFAHFRKRRRFTSDQLTRASLFASQAAIAIGNALKFREAEALGAVARRLLSTESLQETLNSVAEIASYMLGSKEVSSVVSRVILREEHDLVVRAVDGCDPSILGTSCSSGTGSQAGFAVEMTEPIFSDYERESRFSVADEKRGGFKSGISARMMAGGDLIGVLEIRSERPRQFGDVHAMLLSSLAAHAALAIKRDQRSASLRRRRGHLQALRDAEVTVERAHRGQLTRNEALRDLLRITVECYRRYSLDPIATTFGTLFRVGLADTLTVECVYPLELGPQSGEAIISERSLRVPPVGITGRAVLDKTPQLGLNLPHGHPDHFVMVATTRSEIATPIISLGSVVGVLNVESDARRAFDVDDLHTLTSLASLFSISLANFGTRHISHMAHDLSHSMAITRNRTRHLLNSANELDRHALVGMLKQQLTDLSLQDRVTQDIMTTAMVVNNEALQPESTSLTNLIEAVVTSLTEAAAEKHIQLDKKIWEAAPIIVWIDEDRMRQAITNIVANALRYTEPPGKIEVRVTRDRTSDRVVIAVIDSGPNRPSKSDLLRLFEHEERGLGLSIAKTLVEAHGGHIWAERNDQGGLTVAFDLDTKRRGAPS
jgi:GAF domain-containing protein